MIKLLLCIIVSFTVSSGSAVKVKGKLVSYNDKTFKLLTLDKDAKGEAVKKTIRLPLHHLPKKMRAKRHRYLNKVINLNIEVSEFNRLKN